MPRNSLRKRRVAAMSLHSSVPCESSSELTSEEVVMAVLLRSYGA